MSCPSVTSCCALPASENRTTYTQTYIENILKANSDDCCCLGTLAGCSDVSHLAQTTINMNPKGLNGCVPAMIWFSKYGARTFCCCAMHQVRPNLSDTPIERVKRCGLCTLSVSCLFPACCAMTKAYTQLKDFKPPTTIAMT